MSVLRWLRKLRGVNNKEEKKIEYFDFVDEVSLNHCKRFFSLSLVSSKRKNKPHLLYFMALIVKW